MKLFKTSGFVLVTALCLSCVCTLAQSAEQRVALLIGNSDYTVSPLRNPPNDVREMEAALNALGFKVRKVLNANQNQMKRAVREFGSLAQGADVALIYYSGHGTQVAGENFLLPIGASIEKESDYEVEAVSANGLMRQIAGARPKAAIVVLDACRDNPHASQTKSTSKGLSRMDAPNGTMIAFATSPNSTAGDDGLYARVLASKLRTPGLEILDVFRDTTAEVRRLTNGRQEPRISEVSISDRIFLAGYGSGSPPRQTLNPPTADYLYGPVVRRSDGTTVVQLDEVRTIMLKTCEEGTEYINKRCVGQPRLYTVAEAHEAANAANRDAFAGFSNWAVPDYMVLLGIYANLTRALVTEKDAKLIDPFGIDATTAKGLFLTGVEGLNTWMLPRGGTWTATRNADIGGGIEYRRDGKYRLRLYRVMQ